MSPQSAPKRRTKPPKARPVRGGPVVKPKITKEERRAKYTQLARDRSEKRRRQQNFSNVVCYQCRQKGHGVADCPNNNHQNNYPRKQNKKNKIQQSEAPSKICYKCGSTEHGLHSCPQWKPGDTDLPHCLCFVCHEKGHLASQCPQNDHGVFVYGGECKECGSKRHKSQDCPNKTATQQSDKQKKQSGSNSDVQEENWDSLLEGKGDEQIESTVVKDKEYLVISNSTKTTPRRVVNF